MKVNQNGYTSFSVDMLIIYLGDLYALRWIFANSAIGIGFLLGYIINDYLLVQSDRQIPVGNE